MVRLPHGAPPLHALLVALAVALLACPAVQPPRGGAREGGQGQGREAEKAAGTAASLSKMAVVERGSSDPARRRPAPVPAGRRIEAAVAQAKALGIDTIRVTAGWSSLTRAADQPAGLPAPTPATPAPTSSPAGDSDRRVHAIRGGGLRVPLDIGFWAPRSATTDRRPAGAREIEPAGYGDYATAVALRCSGSSPPPSRRTPRRPPPTPARVDRPVAPAPVLPFPVPDALGGSPAHDPADPDGASPAAPRAAHAPPPPGAQREAPGRRRVHPLERAQPPGPAAAAVEGRQDDAGQPRVYRAMLRAGYAAVKAVRKKATVLIGNTSSTGGTRGAGPSRRWSSCASSPASTQAHAAQDARLRELHPAAGRRLGAPPVLAERAPVARQQARERARRPAPRRPAAARHDARPAREDGPPRARQPQHLPHRVRLRDPAGRRPADDRRAPAGPLADVGQVPRREGPDRALVRAVLAARPAAGRERVSESKARPFGQYSTGLLVADGKDKIAAKTFVAASSRRSAARAACCCSAACGSAPGADRDRPAAVRAARGSRSTRRRSTAARRSRARSPSAGLAVPARLPRPEGPAQDGIAIKPVGRGRQAAGATLLPSRAACQRLPSSSARAARRPRRSSPRPA